jgi:hypothetical protein
LVEEGRRVGEAAAANGVSLRLCGGVAVAITCPSARRAPLAREYADLDLVCRAGDRRSITSLMIDLGYEEAEGFNAMQGGRRMLFHDRPGGRHVDVFVDQFSMCHTIDLRDRLGTTGATLSLADLLLMKLQVVETNHKDLVDVTAILTDHRLESDPDGLDRDYLAEVLGGDWGLWKTCDTVLEKIPAFVQGLAGFSAQGVVESRVDELKDLLGSAPKSRRWRMRARIGTRVRWYELPEEIE